MSHTVRRRLRRRPPVALAAALAVTAAFGVVGGGRGAAVGLAVGTFAVLLPAPVGYVLGHLCLGLVPGEFGWARLALLEAGLVSLLLADLSDPLDRRDRLVAAGGVVVAVGALGAPALWLAPPVGTPWTSVAALLSVTVAVGGVLWRYEAVRTTDPTSAGEAPDE